MLQAPCEAAATNGRVARASGVAGRVLIVEDDRALLELLRGHPARSAGSTSPPPATARAPCGPSGAGAFDVVLTDVDPAGRQRRRRAARGARARPRRAGGARHRQPVGRDGGPGGRAGCPALPGEAGRRRPSSCAVSRTPLAAAAGRVQAARRCATSGRPDGRMRDRAGLEAVSRRALELALHDLPADPAHARRLGLRLGGPAAHEGAGGRRPARVPRDGRAARPRARAGPADPRRASRARPGARAGACSSSTCIADDLLDESLFDPAAPLSALAPDDRARDHRAQPDRERAGRAASACDGCARSGSAWRSTTSAPATRGSTSFASLEPDFVKLDRGPRRGPRPRADEAQAGRRRSQR